MQSHVPQVMELHTYLSMVTQFGKLTDWPTFKEKVAQQPDNVNYGLLGYPVLMTADIVLYKADVVPVGIDQAPHLEFARELVRSFNYRYNTKVLLEPQVKHTEVLKVLGIDGKNKMSKSLNNHIELASTPEETTGRVREMVTDPARIKRTDPGNPDICNVFSMHRIFSPQEEVEMINIECRRAGEFRRKADEEKAKVQKPEDKQKVESRVKSRLDELKKKQESEKAELAKRQKAEEEKAKQAEVKKKVDKS